MEKQKICIIGGGLIGLLTAATLSKLNLKIDLVVGNNIKNIKTNRTTAISQENYNNLVNLKIFKYLKKDFWSCSKMKLYTENDHKKIDEIFELNNEKKLKKQILYMMNNASITKSIVEYLKNEKLVTFKPHKKISKIISSGLLKGIKSTNADFSKYNLIILCTGSESNLSKKSIKSDYINHNYNEVSVTTIIKHNYVKNNIVRQIFFNDEILALLPISNTKTSVVWSLKKKIFNKYKNGKNIFLKKQIKSYANKFLEKINFVSKIEIKDLNLLIKKKYHDDRILLFGDALHVVHPFAGQGFNMSLRDLKSLEKILKNKLKLGLDVGSSDILSELSSEIKPRNFIYSLGIDFIKNFFSTKDKNFRNFRNVIMTKLNKNNFIKNIFYNLADEGLKF